MLLHHMLALQQVPPAWAHRTPATAAASERPAPHSYTSQTPWIPTRVPGCGKTAQRPGHGAAPRAVSVETATVETEEEEGLEDEDEELGGGAASSVVRIQIVRDSPRFDLPLLLGSIVSITRTAVSEVATRLPAGLDELCMVFFAG